MLELNCFDVLKPCRRKATGSESEHKTPKCWKDLIFEHVFVKLKSMKYFLFRVVFLLKIRHTRDLINAWVFLNDGKTLGKSCWYFMRWNYEKYIKKLWITTSVMLNFILNFRLESQTSWKKPTFWKWLLTLSSDLIPLHQKKVHTRCPPISERILLTLWQQLIMQI